MTTTASSPAATTPAADPTPGAVAPNAKRVFIGLMLGMLVASLSQTIVGPALPRIVAELGGMEHYSWLATAAMLVSAVVVPIVGKLSDLYGRRRFYLAGLVVFMLGSVLAGLAPNFWFLVGARALQGLGMGTLMPLSQTILGDIVAPRQRGKYQGLLGAVFGVSSVVGPLVGGLVTDLWGWRWLFFITLPLGIVAVVAISRFLHLPHVTRRARIDYAGMATLVVALVSLLLATSLGGTSFPWGSAQVLGLYAVGLVALVAFLVTETRAVEPVLPLRMFRSSIFTLSNIANFAVSMLMFGAIIYVPVFAQGVLGASASESGMILIPMSVAMIGVSILSGLLITRFGRYKVITLVGLLVMASGLWWLTRLGYGSSQLTLVFAMAVFGAGLGSVMQVYTLVIQNAADHREMGVATATSQFFRNVGSTVGVAVFGSVMTARLATTIPAHLPPGTAVEGGTDIGSVIDPAALAGLPGPVVEAIRLGLADALNSVFLLGLPLAALAIVATLLIRNRPLRETLHAHAPAEPEDAVPAS